MKPNRQKVYAKYDGKCGYCGHELRYDEMQIDHIIPKHQFNKGHVGPEYSVPDFLRHLTKTDANHFDNLMPACHTCNFYKGTETLYQFAESIRTIPDRMHKFGIIALGIRHGKIQGNTIPVIFYFEKVGKK